jgi:hypothetical protein
VGFLSRSLVGIVIIAEFSPILVGVHCIENLDSFPVEIFWLGGVAIEKAAASDPVMVIALVLRVNNKEPLFLIVISVAFDRVRITSPPSIVPPWEISASW